MPAAIDRLFLDYSVNKLRQYADRIVACLAELEPDQIWSRGGASQNAAGNLVLHLCGNVQQWIVSGIDGQPDQRDRDAEFDSRGGVDAVELVLRLKATVEKAVAVIASVPAERLSERLLVQSYDVSVLEAIYHVVEHFSMHAGQIIFITKMLTGRDLGFYRHLGKSAAHGETTP